MCVEARFTYVFDKALRPVLMVIEMAGLKVVEIEVLRNYKLSSRGV